MLSLSQVAAITCHTVRMNVFEVTEYRQGVGLERQTFTDTAGALILIGMLVLAVVLFGARPSKALIKQAGVVISTP